MARSQQAIRARIKSVASTQKIIHAMELLSNAKLQKYRKQLQENSEYGKSMNDVLNQVLANMNNDDNIYVRPHKATRRFVILFSSDLGLCGGYNHNAFKEAADYLSNDDTIYVFGTKGYNWLKNHGYTPLNETVVDCSNATYNDISNVVSLALQAYLNDEVGSIELIYTHYVNGVTFTPVVKQLLPLQLDENYQQQTGEYVETLYEPNQQVILDQLIPLALKSIVYTCWIDSNTSEQASRRMAMESANDNAETLSQQLLLQYNQARQAAITQEIQEVVAGADSL